MFKVIRTWRAEQHAFSLWNGFTLHKPDAEITQAVLERIRPHQIVKQQGDLLVTEAGFVTMAIYASLAVKYGSAIVAPGIDDKGNRGFLVLRTTAAPFHSLASSSAEAFSESVSAQLKASTIVKAYGDMKKLRSAVQKASWCLMVKEEDYVRSGLCRWGTESFLERIGLLTLARRFGLPRLLLKIAGPYGDRLTATRLLRQTHGGPQASVNR